MTLRLAHGIAAHLDVRSGSSVAPEKPVGSENSIRPPTRPFACMAGPATVRLHHGKALLSPSPALVVRLPRRPESPFAPPAHPANERVQGDRDPGAAPRARDPAAPTAAATPRRSRSGVALCAEPAPGKGPLVGVLRATRDPFALAPTPGRSALDVPPPPPRTAFHRRGARDADRGDGLGQPDLGVPAHPRRAARL